MAGDVAKELGRSRTRRRIVALLQDRPGHRLHLRAIARQVAASPGNTSRELRRLETAGIVVRSREGAQVYFEAAAGSAPLEPPSSRSPQEPADTGRAVPDPLGVAIARRFASGLETVYGARLRGVYLYGSRARGDHRPDSDVDIMVVLDGIEDYGNDLRRSSGLASDLSLAHGVTVARLLVPEAVWNADERPIVRAVKQEGVAV